MSKSSVAGMKTSTLIEVPAAIDGDRARERLPWPSLVVLGAVTFVVVTGEMLPTAVLPYLSSDLGVPHARTGLLVSLWAATVVVTSIPLARLTARWDRRRVVVIALLVFGASSLLTAAAGTFAAALTTRLVGAAAAGLLWATVNAHTAAVVHERLLARATAVVIAGATLGTVLGVPAANLAARAADWRAAFIAVAAASILAAVAVRLVVIASPDDGAATSRPRVRRPTRVARVAGPDHAAPAGALGALLVVAGFTGLVLVGHFAVHTFVTTVLTDAARVVPGQMSGVLLLLGAVAASAVVLVGRYGDRRPQALLVAAAALIGVSLAAITTAGSHPVVAVGVVVLWGLSSGALPPLAQTMIMRLAGSRHRATAGAIVPVMFNVGIAAGAAGAAAVIAGPGPALLPVAAAVVVLLGAVGLATVLRRTPRASAAEPGAAAGPGRRWTT